MFAFLSPELARNHVLLAAGNKNTKMLQMQILLYYRSILSQLFFLGLGNIFAVINHLLVLKLSLL